MPVVGCALTWLRLEVRQGACAHRFLVVWICTLPLALFRPFQYATPFVCAVIGFLLIGVENIGVQVADVPLSC